MKKTALLSVSDKTNIIDFAKSLYSHDYEIIASSNTLKTLQDASIKATDIAHFTGSEEMFGGRVKTLHPKVHGGILFRRTKASDVSDAKKHGIEPIDLVCVNLYPFKETTKNTNNIEEIIENIDIGGPAMIRAAAKNYSHCIVVTDINDYDNVIHAIEQKKLDDDFRRDLMIKAFEHTASYDVFVAKYFNERFAKTHSKSYNISTKLVNSLRYGENPHQKAGLYEFDEFYSKNLRALKGELSANNIGDISACVAIASGLKNSICIVKHGNPCGFAIDTNMVQCFDKALICDKLSAYGGVVAVNAHVDEDLAKKINEIFVEVLVAPSFDEAALDVFNSKKRIKICALNVDGGLPKKQEATSIKQVLGGLIVQDMDEVTPDEITKAKSVCKQSANDEQMQDLDLAWKLAAHTHSNCVTFVKNKILYAIGMGMTSRLDASKCAIEKAKKQGLDLSGSAMASEAFFPFRDSVDLVSGEGIAVIAQPGGSIRDDEVIGACDEHAIAMYFTNKRHFLH